MRQSCQCMSLTITEMDSTAQFSCAFPLPHPFSRSQGIEIQVTVLIQGMYIAPVVKNVRALGEFFEDLQGQQYTKRKFCTALVPSVLFPLRLLKALSAP